MISDERLKEIRDYDTCVTLEESAEMASRLLAESYTCDLASWEIDHSAGRPILLYKKCSVIEAEDAEYVLRLIRKDNKC